MSPRLHSIALLGAAVLVACGESDTAGPTPATNARVKVIHAIPDAPAVNIRFDNNPDAVTGLQYGQVGPAAAAQYLTVATGQRRIRVFNGATAVIDANQLLETGRNYTILATGRLQGGPAIAPLVLTDNVTAPTDGNIRLRLVHGAASLGNVDIYVGLFGQPLPVTATLTNVAFRGSAYLPVRPAGNYRVCIVLAGAGTAGGCRIDVSTGAIAGGRVATLVALDAPNAQQTPGAVVTLDR